MSSFTENLFLKRMIQQLHEENLKLKSLINEVYRYPSPGDRPVPRPLPYPRYPSPEDRPVPYPRYPSPEDRPVPRPLPYPGFEQQPTKEGGGGLFTGGPHQLPNFPNPRGRIFSTMHDLDALHPANPLRVDDADTGPTHHPGQGPKGAYGKMPDPNDPLVTSKEKKRRELTDIIGQGGGRYPPSQKPTLDDILASGMPPPRPGAERPTKPYGNIFY